MAAMTQETAVATVQILYFAWLRDRLGRAGERAVLPDGVRDVRGLVAWLQAREPAFAAIAGEGRVVRVAVNQEFAGSDDPVSDGDEIGFFPPVTGG